MLGGEASSLVTAGQAEITAARKKHDLPGGGRWVVYGVEMCCRW